LEKNDNTSPKLEHIKFEIAQEMGISGSGKKGHDQKDIKNS